MSAWELDEGDCGRSNGYMQRDEKIGPLRVFLHASQDGWYAEIDGPDVRQSVNQSTAEADTFLDLLKEFLEKCPDCQGSGLPRGFEALDDGLVQDCPACDGTGKRTGPLK